MTQPDSEYDPATAVTVGRVRAAHGIRGELRVESLTDFPERFAPHARLYVDGRLVVVQASRWQGRGVYLKLRGIDDRNAADALVGRDLQAPRPQEITEADTYYQHDIIGLKVETQTGEAIGRVESIFPTGSNDVYVVRGERGEVLLPAIDDVIKQVDTAGKRLVVDLLPGLEFSPPASRPRPSRPQATRRDAGSRG